MPHTSEKAVVFLGMQKQMDTLLPPPSEENCVTFPMLSQTLVLHTFLLLLPLDLFVTTLTS